MEMPTSTSPMVSRCAYRFRCTTSGAIHLYSPLSSPLGNLPSPSLISWLVGSRLYSVANGNTSYNRPVRIQKQSSLMFLRLQSVGIVRCIIFCIIGWRLGLCMFVHCLPPFVSDGVAYVLQGECICFVLPGTLISQLTWLAATTAPLSSSILP